jgi:hypothetical protein
MMNRTRHIFASIALLVAASLGCEETHEARDASRKLLLPDDANVVAEGAGELKFVAKEDGRVFVYDTEDQMLENAKHIRAGQLFELSPNANMATLDGRKVMDQQFKKEHSHRVYFEPE